LPLQISVSGVRGVVGDGLDAVVVARWASAFGAWLPAGPVVVGRDTRPSGGMVLAAVTAALQSTGHDVIDLGVVTTPTTELAVVTERAAGGVIITASHNPQPWNALKFLESRGLFLTADQNRELRARLDTGAGHVPWDRLGAVVSRPGAGERHVDAVLGLPWLDARRVAGRRLRAVVDAVEGAGGEVVPRLLSRLGVDCVRLHCGLSGRFPHDPEPTPAHLAELGEAVRAAHADLGLAVDPDGDRLALVDAAGEPLSEEMTLVLAVDFLLARERGTVVVNLSTTRLIETAAARHGARVLRAPVGEANVVEAMLAAGAVIGGEGNGGVIYPALHAGRDALVGIAMVAQALAESGGTLRELAGAYPPVAMLKDKIAVAGGFEPAGWRPVLAALGPGDLDERDGLKWTGREAWVHVRPSNTEPIVRIIAEAADAAAARKLVEAVRSGTGG
jgi:phosphomannomutase